MTQIYVIGQDDLTAVEIPSAPSNKEENTLANTSNVGGPPPQSNPDTSEENTSSNTDNIESSSNPSTSDQDDLQIDLELENHRTN